MAKLSVAVAFSIAVALFLFTTCQARIPSDLPQDDTTHHELTRSHAVSGVSSVLHLLSDSVNADESRFNQPTVDIPEPDTISIRYIPLRVATFRPINRRFPISSRLRFRHCRHRHHHDPPFFKPIRQQQDHSYGKDMILSSDESNEFDPFIFHHDRMHQIPAKWAKFHHHHHNGHDEEDHDGFSKYVSTHSHRLGKKFKKHLRHHEEKEDEETHEEMKKREGKREEESSFVKRIREFLGHF